MAQPSPSERSVMVLVPSSAVNVGMFLVFGKSRGKAARITTVSSPLFAHSGCIAAVKNNQQPQRKRQSYRRFYIFTDTV